ncbi:hypothetical protein A584_16358 [Pseudomonas syringae pv. theae ICMP 3923]|uniref:Uncharacterized protein n=1 Tax=Pseudomonas syringae pv. theae TaxID=103985 RepID=A0A0Q0DRK4_PSESX|nr:hypothetical protein [Pseudomonas syringae]EPM68894.1 hypothetical protein A584_16358 [Pseudomonas syringae pv. theae ICMP 3923]KPZ31603.1 hypothetical protein AN901_204089 [Pseudomonas syringae pv. theae]MBL3873557.1 hypothetical protein [Pseudomonas syringae pv. theae]RMT71015.1 hypothetical protein ALP44_02281 [Pseudomonas syringae pv. theae]GKQ28345.1 hypothetical protein PSTH68_02520 [Pseudomonas syringae pv. theae]
MRKPYSLSEDEFNKLQRAQESIQLMSILLDEVQRPSTFTPGMLASFMALVGEDMGGVLQSVGGTLSPR